MYTVPDNSSIENYVVQSNELNPHLLPSPVFVNVERMAYNGTPEFAVEPSFYHPAAPNYSYYSTEFESPSEWEDSHAFFGVDGAEVQYAGAQAENMSYVYYTPGYGYEDSSFNPYNPYIPCAMIGVDGIFVGTQPYYTISPYHNEVSSSGYAPALAQSGAHVVASSSTGTSLDLSSSAMNRVITSSAKRTQPPTPSTFSVNPSKTSPSQAHALSVASQGAKAHSGTRGHPMSNHNYGSVHGASSHVHQTGNASISLPSAENFLYQKFPPQAENMNLSFAANNGVSNYGSGTNGQAVLNEPWSQYYYRSISNDASRNGDPLGEQNRGPRTSKSKNKLILKAYTTKAGDCNSEGNIAISADSYNKDNFPVDYENCKFFVIKSYSEDDVHKSMKYNVWSSTPNGNKKLNSAYEEAQRIAAGKPGHCPIFLYFSVNASGQFCGVAEMVGAVDFDNNMDFWQQDKWSGSFPVKWHMIKDVPNPNFRHIILENNEHKPVTNSRDTQEIMYKQGTEMLKLFKNYSSKTSLLDDFMFYEHRQKIMHEERAHLFRKANINGHPIAPLIKLASNNSSIGSVKPLNSSTDKLSCANVDNHGGTSTKEKSSEDHSEGVSSLKMGSLSIHPKQSEGNLTLPTSCLTSVPPASVVTVGSMPDKVDTVNPRSSGTLTIGTIPLDPKALRQGKVGGFGKGGQAR